jgi:hypothetical protein
MLIIGIPSRRFTGSRFSGGAESALSPLCVDFSGESSIMEPAANRKGHPPNAFPPFRNPILPWPSKRIIVYSPDWKP